MIAPPALSAPHAPALGLIVLSVDETIETEFRTLIPPQAARLHVTRVRAGGDLTPGSIAAMEARLTDAARLLPEAAQFSVVGYACTSATAQLGAETVRARITAGAHADHVTDPLTAVLAQIAALGLRRVAILSPYTEDVAAPIRAAFNTAGIDVPAMASFNEATEARVARIEPASTFDAAQRLAASTQADGLFLSCTNLQTQQVRAPLQEALGLPVLSSNHALAWHMAQLAGLDLPALTRLS